MVSTNEEKRKMSEKQRLAMCHHWSFFVAIESVVIILVVLSTVALTGDVLIRFDLITVPKNGTYITNGNNISTISSTVATQFGNSSTNNSEREYQPTIDLDKEMFYEDERVMDILEKVFHYTSLGIAVLFCAEILLKICFTCPEMVHHKWQIFDVVVVVVTVAVELTLHFVDVPWESLHFIKYVVVLRLWRVPFVCNLKADYVMEMAEQDSEMYRIGQQSVDDKCARLEWTIANQAEIIRQLEATLSTYTNNSGSEGDRSWMATTDGLATGSLPARKHIPGATQIRRGLLRRSKKNPAYVGEEETTFSTDETLPIDQQTLAMPTLMHSSSSKDLHNNNTPIYHTNTPIYNTHSRDSYVPIDKIAYDIHSPSLYQIQQEATDSPQPDKTVTTKNKIQSRPRRKTRRSSTSEYIEYSRMSASSGTDATRNSDPDKTSDSHLTESNPGRDSGLPSSHSNSSASEGSSALSAHVRKKGEREVPKAWSSGLSDESGLGAEFAEGDDQGENRIAEDIVQVGESDFQHSGKGLRRFPSCPEYAFTQKMALTTDESALIIDDDAENNEYLQSIHDNLGFVMTDEESFHVLAEFDGTKTYRSEEGIPMTSL